VQKKHTPNVLFLIGTYTIGKERVLLQVAKVVGCKVCVSKQKYAVMLYVFLALLLSHDMERRYDILARLNLDMSVFTTDPSVTPVHAVPMGVCSFQGLLCPHCRRSGIVSAHSLCAGVERMGALRAYDRVVAFTPTGWSQTRVSRRTRDRITVISVPYSEHSSFDELRDCVQVWAPKHIIPTVNYRGPGANEARAMQSRSQAVR
jgi:hypothetical protein